MTTVDITVDLTFSDSQGTELVTTLVGLSSRKMRPQDLGNAPELVESIVEGGWRHSDHVGVAEVAGHAGRHQGPMEYGGVAVNPQADLGAPAIGLPGADDGDAALREPVQLGQEEVGHGQALLPQCGHARLVVDGQGRSVAGHGHHRGVGDLPGSSAPLCLELPHLEAGLGVRAPPAVEAGQVAAGVPVVDE